VLDTQAVGWNRQKKIYDWLIFGFACFTCSHLFYLLPSFNPDYTFETVLIRSTSTLAVLLLHIILSIGPLARLIKSFYHYYTTVGTFGVTMFCIAAVHGVFSILQFHTLWQCQSICFFIYFQYKF
jgi:hypothetical protein